MKNKILYSDDNCQFHQHEDGSYCLAFFKENHWHGEITFSSEGDIICNDNLKISDGTIMQILNAMGYEDEKWIDFVREHLG